LWRSGVRLGPLAAARPPARRSLAEQIRGTARFLVRHGGGCALHAATLRALDEAAARRVAGYGRLERTQRCDALAALTPFTSEALAAAVHDSGLRRPRELGATLTVLETARRHILDQPTRPTHAAD
jgi:hypothetical protein